MVTLEDFKKTLGKTAKTLTEEEIINLMELQAKLARVVFDMWSKSFKTKSTNDIK